MIHTMSLNPEPFSQMKAGTKTIEFLLHDDKRQKVCIGHQIRFTNKSTNEQLLVKVIGLMIFRTFEELIAHLDKEYFKAASKQSTLETIHQIYPQE